MPSRQASVKRGDMEYGRVYRLLSVWDIHRKTPVCESIVPSIRTVYTVLSKNVLESECLFVVSYAIIYFSKNMDFTGRCESTITVVHNSLSQIFLIFTYILDVMFCCVEENIVNPTLIAQVRKVGETYEFLQDMDLSPYLSDIKELLLSLNFPPHL